MTDRRLPPDWWRGLITRRQALASPFLAVLGKVFGAQVAPAQHRSSTMPSVVASAMSDKGASLRPALQDAIDHFDFSFLPLADLTFALIADSHSDKRPTSVPLNPECYRPELLGAKGRNDLNDRRAAKVYAQLNANRPRSPPTPADNCRAAFLIHLGDLIHGHPRDNRWAIQVAKVRKLLEILEIPVHLVPGNHDIGNKLSASMPGGRWPGSTENPRDVYYVSAENIQACEQAFGASYFHFESSGCLFLVVNASVLGSGLEAEGQQWRWLEETLAASDTFANIFLCMHSLPYWSRVDEPGKRNYEIVDEPGRSRLLALCAEHDVRAIFTGHIHHDFLRYHGSTLIAASPATAFSRDNWGLYYPLAAPTWDPARSAYCYVRVHGRKIVRQLVRTVDLLPAAVPCQHGASPPRRLIARQTADGIAGVAVVTVPVIRHHAGLSAPENALSRRGPGAGRADELWVAWVSGRPQQSETWLEVSFARPQTVGHIVIEPGMRTPFAYQIQLRAGAGSWTEVARGKTEPPRGDRPPPAIEHSIDVAEAAAVRLLVPRTRGVISVRGLRIFNPEAVDVAAIPALSSVSASSSERQVGVVNTAAFTQGFDLNPRYLRLDPRATALPVVSPVPDLFVVDPWVVESARHARREGARLWVVLTADPAGRVDDDLKAFRTYCRELARALEGVEVWEIDGDQRHATAAMAAIGKVSSGARFAVREGIEVPPNGFAVARADHLPAEADPATLLVYPPFPSRRHEVFANRLGQWLARSLGSEDRIPCVSLLPGEGLLDGWHDPMYAFYVVRAFNTVLAGARPSARHCQSEPGLEAVHLTSPAGRFVVASRAPGAAPAASRLRLLKDAAEAWWIDPLTSTSTQLALEGRELRGLSFPDYPVILRLV